MVRKRLLLVVYLFVLRVGQFDSSIRAFYTSLIQDAIPDSERETQFHCLDYLMKNLIPN